MGYQAFSGAYLLLPMDNTSFVGTRFMGRTYFFWNLVNVIAGLQGEVAGADLVVLG